MSGGRHSSAEPPAEGTVEPTGGQPAGDPVEAPAPAGALPPAPYGAVPPPLAAPTTSALAGHPISRAPTEHRGRPRPDTRASPLGSALPPPATPATPDPQVGPDTQLIPGLPPVPVAAPQPDADQLPAGSREEAPGGSRGILRAAGTMAVASLVSRITGLLRTVVLAAVLGVLLTGDAYTTANTLPNIVYELLIGGVLSSVVVPLLVRSQDEDADGGVGYAQRLFTVTTTLLVVLTGVAIAAAPLLTRLYGIADDPAQVALANWLARILLLEIVFYGIGALATAVLNSRNVFGPPAWAPVLNNVVVIGTAVLLGLASGPGSLEPMAIAPWQVWLLGGGTTLGIVVQALVLLPSVRRVGIPLRPRWGLRNTGLAEAGSLGLWVVGYAAISQIGVIVATRIANTATREGGLGSNAFLIAGLLFQMPYGIIGVALLTALLPRMSRAAGRGDVAGVSADLSLGLRLSAIGLLPITAVLVVLGPALTTVAFAWRNTSIEQAQMIGGALSVGAFGLLPMAVTLLQLRVFYAMKDARTPTIIQLAMVAVRVPLLLLVPAVVAPRHVVAGLMIATSITYVAGWIVGNIALRRKLGPLRLGDAGGTVLRMLAVSVAAGLVGWGAVALTPGISGTSFVDSLLTVLVGTVVIGAVVVGGVVLASVPEIAGPVAAVRARLGRARR